MIMERSVLLSQLFVLFKQSMIETLCALKKEYVQLCFNY